MTPATRRRTAWCLWILGTALIVLNWIGVVSAEIGWCGFAVAISGTVLSLSRTQKSDASGDPNPQAITDRPQTDASGPLPYRSPLDEPIPPSTSDVFRGLFF